MNDIVDAPSLAQRIEHAKAYPFSRPASSYLFTKGSMQPLTDQAWRDRTPVIASGSNASPGRLAAKFGMHERIPVTRASLRDFAVVFAGHFTAYGAIPATLYRVDGASAEVWITWLTSSQLEVMHQSEGVIGCREAEQRYDYVELNDLNVETDIGPPIGRAGAYLSRRMLAPDGDPLRMAEVLASAPKLKAWSHPAALHLVAKILAPDQSFKCFMASVLSGVQQRQALFKTLTPSTLSRLT